MIGKSAKLLISLGFASLLSSAAIAEDYPRINIIDFVVDWKMYAGKYIVVQGGTMNFADQTSAQLHAEGAHVVVLAPYKNKENLRYLLKNCSGIGPPDKCAMDVFGQVKTEAVGNFPTLINPQIPQMSQ